MNLDELRIYAPFQNHPLRCIHTLVRLIHLVTSPCLRRVVVEVANVTFEDIDWDPMDEALVDLVERHKAYGNLVFQQRRIRRSFVGRFREQYRRACWKCASASARIIIRTSRNAFVRIFLYRVYLRYHRQQ